MTAVGLSAAQWIPSLAVAARSARAHLPAEARGYWSVHPAALLLANVPLPCLLTYPLAGTNAARAVSQQFQTGVGIEQFAEPSRNVIRDCCPYC